MNEIDLARVHKIDCRRLNNAQMSALRAQAMGKATTAEEGVLLQAADEQDIPKGDA